MKKRIDFLDVLVEDILDNFTYREDNKKLGIKEGDKLFATVLSPMFGDGNSIAVFPMPINNYDHYMDGSYRQQFAFQVMTKQTNQMMGYYTVQVLTDYLRDIEDIPSKRGSYQFEEMTVVTDPNVVGKDEKYYQFSAQFNASLYIKN